MLYFCVKTNEYLQSIIDIVSRGSGYYKQIDVDVNKAESVINKFTDRYNANISSRQRSYLRETKKCVFDIVILYNQSLAKYEKIRFCVLATFPDDADISRGHDEYILKSIGGEFRYDFERFYDVTDRKTRFCYHFAADHKVPVYELVKLPYSAQEIKEKGIKATDSWTFRLHKDFLKIKSKSIEQAFKKAQHSKRLSTFQLDILPSLAGFRGVRDDVFRLNKDVFRLSHKYLNCSASNLDIELKKPQYVKKIARLTHSFDEMVQFTSEYVEHA